MFFEWVVADIAQVFELEVEEYGVFVAVFAGNIALADQACAPAAAVAFIFSSYQHFKRFLA